MEGAVYGSRVPGNAPIGVYAATGYTGRLVVRELLAAGREVVLSGRSADRLAALAAELGGDLRVAPAELGDPEGLRDAFAGLAAVVSCAGPFVHHGAPVLEAAIAAGAHYVDTTGEQPWIKRVFDAFDAPARRAGVTAVPAMGFDYVPGDLLASLVGAPLQPLRELTLAYAVSGFGATRGTLRSALEMLGAEEVVYEDGAWRPAPALGPLRARFPFPEPVGSVPVVRYPAGEVITAPQHLAVRTVRTVIDARMFAPVPALAGAVPVLAPALGLALRGPVRRALDAAIGRLPEGPDAAARAASRFLVACTATAEDGRRAHGLVRGRDVYGLTGHLAARGAILLADGLGRAAGAQPPAGAFDPEALLADLHPRGVTWERHGAGARASARPA